MRDRNKKPNREAQFPAGRFKNLYDDALKPVRADAGSPYVVSQHVIDQVAGTIKARHSRPTVDERDAALEVSGHNDLLRKVPANSAECDAIKRLAAIFGALDSPHQLGPDLIIKTFRDLDLVFFAGRLLGFVDVRWSPNVTHMAVYGHVEHGDNGTARVIMDARRCFLQCRELSPWHEIFGTLLHEMTVSGLYAGQLPLLTRLHSTHYLM